MPTYEYECGSCGHRFERLQAMSDERVKSCPECSRPVRRLIAGGAGIIAKGAGCEFARCCASGGAEAPCGARAGECDGPACGSMPR